MTYQEDQLAPSPSRLVESLRDTGYSYQAAFADIVDNSIAAEATHIEVDIAESAFGGDVTVTFYDNGRGMDASELREAMRYGSKKRSSPKSLGKFGMGLKTASTAFCRKLTVISKQDEVYHAACWDIDVIIERDEWLLLTPPLEEYAEQIEKLCSMAGSDSGTVVIWDEVDRLISASGSDYSSQALSLLESEIREHLAATFGKFLIGRENFKNGLTGISAPDVIIKLNGEDIVGWDPTGQFLNTENEPDRVLFEKKVQGVTLRDGVTKKPKFELNGYVLPNKNKMTDEELALVRFGNDNQGFYIYREDRLIYGGGWPHRLFSQDSHLNLLRVELNFDHELDEYFEIDIRKSKINLPVKIRDEFKKALAPWRNEASRRYRRNKPDPGLEHEPAVDGNSGRYPHEDSSRVIERQVDNAPMVEIVNYHQNDTATIIRNRFGEVEINRAAVVKDVGVYVITVPSIEGDMLWDIDITEDNRPVVVLNEGHEFYRRFYLRSDVTPVFIQAMDSLFWALANTELNCISDLAKRNFQELRFALSSTLRQLSEELPDVR